jgi:hypothetical protein
MTILIRGVGLVYLLVGGWQALAPQSFTSQAFADFPPFNAHFVRDVSSFYLAAGIALLVAAREPARHRLMLVLVALQSGFHALNHLYDATLGQGPSWHLFTDALPLVLATGVLVLPLLERVSLLTQRRAR